MGKTENDRSLFFSDEEIVEITGLTNPTAQERLLRSWGLNVYRNRANKVKLAKEAFIRWQLGEKIKKESEPQLKFLR